ncbi:MAG: ATP-binding protein [Rikenellaceae bacterium]
MKREIIKQIILDNQIEVASYQVNPRNFRFEDFGNYVLVGIRRAGKSFLLYQRMQELLSQGMDWSDMLYINFEDERLIDIGVEDLNLLLEVHLELYNRRPILFLDEIQNIDGWEKFARRLADSKYRVYITGSNAKMLSTDVQTTLGGRYLTVEVYPYSFEEFLRVNDLNVDESLFHSTASRANIFNLFEDYFLYGGFPEGATLSAKRNYLTSVYQKIYLGDIAARNKVDNNFALRVMFKKIAESIKQPLSFSRISKILSSTGVKIGTQTVINYIGYAKNAWLLSSIQNIAGKIADKESNPKYYFIDNGILSLLLLNTNTSLLENLVAVTLLRRYGRQDAVFFYNKNVEVDFYIPDEEIAIQVCYNLSTDSDTYQREVRALIKLQKVLPSKRMIIITKEEERTIEIEDKTIEVIPIYKWLLFDSMLKSDTLYK